MVSLALGAALAVALGVGWVMIRLGPQLGFVDTGDDELKIHQGVVVPLGGVGVFLGLHLGLALMDRLDPGLLAATTIVFFLGLVDDRATLSPVTRLVVTAGAGLAMVLVSDDINGFWVGLSATVLVVIVVNAVNMIDGLDALAGTVTSVGALGMAALTATLAAVGSMDPVVLAAAVVGFLVWNIPPARLFLGDNGSYVIGITLAWAAVRLFDGWAPALLAVVAIGVPLFELGSTVLRRLVAKGELFGGDRDHSYDLLHRRGLSPLQVAGVMGGAQLVWAAVVVFLATLADLRAAALIGVALALLIGLLLTTLQVRSLGRPDTTPEPR